MKTTEVQMINQFDRVSKIPFRELATNYSKIREEIMAADGELAPEVEDLFDQIRDLISGKADRVAVFVKEVIPAHIDACKAQIKKLERLRDRVEEIAHQAVVLSGEDSIEGLAWRIRLQYGKPKVTIENEGLLPDRYRDRTVTIRHHFPLGDEAWEQYWAAFAQTHGQTDQFDFEIETQINTSDIREVCKQGRKIPGVRFESEQHLRIESGLNKPAKKPGRTLKLVGGMK